jgi:hypothetical protein
MLRGVLIVGLGLACVAWACSRSVVAASIDTPAEERFEADVRPALLQTCFPCHGGKKTSGGLQVNSREALLRGGERGPAIVPGDPATSLLVRAIGHQDEDLKMPPGKRLKQETTSAIARWVAEGAPWPASSTNTVGDVSFRAGRHWAFEPVRSVNPPADPSGWSAHPIDRFIAAAHRAAGIRPVAQADRRTLIRRVTFDLIGLPPSPEEIEDFLADASPDAFAFARVVERLLSSPRYGERWGRHWMDVVRYADTAGDNADYPIPEAARYRNYIIASFNADKPYDQFVHEQLAGDLMAAGAKDGQAAEKIVATGFLALSRRYATAPYELWHLTLEDTLETTGRAFLGLSLRCARCHDHKFDPVSQRDYYALYGIFASTQFPYAGSEELVTKKFARMHFVPIVPATQAQAGVKSHADRLKSVERQIASLEHEAARKTQGQPNDKAAAPRLSALKAEHERLRRLGLPADLPCAYAVTEGRPENVVIQRGGDPDRPGPVVPRAVPRFAFLSGSTPPSVPEGASGRTELARWLTRPDHPLTPRVIANRVWQHHFGRGIVATPSNFGLRGEPPSHPELLDWLAARLVSSGWSIKDLHRQILFSRTYQLSSEFDDANAAVDPGNRRLWRFDRRRLDAESIRDAMLAVSGLLDSRMPARHPFPPIEEWHWTQHNAFKAVYPTRQRSVFLMTQRLVKHPFLAVFDGPDTNTSSEVRSRSTVPLQALYLMNNPFVNEQAAAFAGRVLMAARGPDQRLDRAWELAWGRLPAARERERAGRYLKRYTAEATSRGGTGPDGSPEREAWISLARVLITANEFLYIE